MLVLSNGSEASFNGTKESELNLSQPKVFCLPAGFSGCAHWRYRLPFGKLKKLGSKLDIHIEDNPRKTIKLEEISEQVGRSDIVSIQAPGHKTAITLMNLYKSQGKKVVVDYDDYSFDLSEGNPRYSELGTEERELLGPDGKHAFKWRDQENGFDLKSNKAKYQAFKDAIAQADMVTTTTEYLAEKFRQHNSNVQVCPNSIDFDLWRPIPRPKEMQDEIRIGWFGGDSHFVDLEIFKNLLPRLANKYPKVKIVIQAPPMLEWAQFFNKIPKEQLEWYGWAELKWYTLFLASRHFDIGLCPLADNDFNRAKSSIKWMEFAALGATVVAQDMLPYNEFIKNGVNGLLATDEDSWFNQISQLTEDKPYREKLALNAYEDIQENHNLDINCRIFEKKYLNLLA